MDEKIHIQYNQVEEAITIMKEVAHWGRKQGFRVWLDEWLTKEELITEEAKSINFCLGKIGEESVCAFILQEKDTVYWPEDTKGEALYLHKLCVRREYAHRNMTQKLIDTLKEEGRLRRKRYIRLDTRLDEIVVSKIYLDAGFKIVKIIDYDNGKSMALYELEV